MCTGKKGQLLNMDFNVLKDQSPIVVVGTGGSGTRVVNEVLMKCGCYIGRNLNLALDNMDFAFTFPARITWLRKTFPFETIDQRKSAGEALSLFLKLNFKQRLTLQDRIFYLKIFCEYFERDNFRLLRRKSLHERIENFLTHHRSKPSPVSISTVNHVKWGFKLPGATFCLNFLIDSFPGIKIVHVVRDGRDMAFGGNQNLLLFYAGFFGLPKEYSPRNSFVFWSRVNHWAYDLCTKRLGRDQYHIVRFEDICLQPKREIDKLLAFVDLQSRANNFELYNIPQKIPSIGRWRKNASVLKDVDESTLRLFGFVLK